MTFPIALDLRGRRCLVVGSGDEARRRVRQLLDAGADVLWVTPIQPEPSDPPCFTVRAFEEADVQNAWLVILADRDAALAERMSRACEATRVFFCAIDQPAFNSFSHMALVHAAPVTLAISTDGRAPALARRLQQQLAALFTPEVLAYFQRIATLRTLLPSGEQRTAALKALLAPMQLRGALYVPPITTESEATASEVESHSNDTSDASSPRFSDE